MKTRLIYSVLILTLTIVFVFSDIKLHPYIIVALTLLYGLHSVYSTIKSIKKGKEFDKALRVKKMSLGFYFYLLLILIIRELFLSESIDKYYLTFFCLIEITQVLESYLDKKHQKILFAIDNNTLVCNYGYFTTTRTISELKAITFHAVGNYFALVFEKERSINFYRDLFITSEMNDFINQLVNLSQKDVIISEESKEKLALK